MPDAPNVLLYGDNLDNLRRKVDTESVDLCYIDPPFNSKRTYNQIYNRVGREDVAQAQAFVDTWTWDHWADAGLDEILSDVGGRYTPQAVALIKGLADVLGKDSLLAYIISMTQRIAEIHRVLKPTGSFYLHCDPSASHYLKLVLDAVFCGRGGDYQAEISWKRSSAHSDTKQGLAKHGRIHDVLLFYTKSTRDWTWNPQYTQYDEEYVRQRFGNRDAVGAYKDADLTAARPGGDTSYEWPVKRPSKGAWTSDLTSEWRSPKPDWEYKKVRPSAGRFWAYSRENMMKFAAADRLHHFSSGMPRLKQYAADLPGVPLQDLWTDIPPINSQAAERLGYQTQKPEALLARIIATSSNAGDVVLDAYCGCGTTVAVAHQLGRRWIGMDITYQAISLMLRRLERTFGPEVLAAVRTDGIPRDVESARALAHRPDDRTRKEFEKWAVLTFTNNRAVINEKKGADAGIDGTAFFQTGSTDNAKIVFQVKSGGVERKDIATLRGDMGRSGAALGVLLTLEDPTVQMRREAKAAGQYRHELMGRSYDCISVVTVREMLEQGARLDIPMSLEVLAEAQRAADSRQIELMPAESPYPMRTEARPLRHAAEPEPKGYPKHAKRRRKPT